MEEQSSDKAKDNNLSGMLKGDEKVRMVAALLALFLGSFGVHKFYLKNKKMGIIYLVFFWSGIPGIVGFVEGIMMLLMTDDAFNQKYNK